MRDLSNPLDLTEEGIHFSILGPTTGLAPANRQFNLTLCLVSHTTAPKRMAKGDRNIVSEPRRDYEHQLHQCKWSLQK